MSASTKTVSFHLVDVFSDTAFTGNPLAIVPSADSLTVPQLQLITRQFNLSETTFIVQPTISTATWQLRSFLPSGLEVFGPGHNSLGVWWWLAAQGLLQVNEGENTFWQQLGENVQEVKIRKSKEGVITVGLWHLPPAFYRIHPDVKRLSAVVGLTEADIGNPSEISIAQELPTQVAATSESLHLMVPLRSLDALDRVSTNPVTLAAELDAVGAEGHGIYFFVVLESTGSETTVRARFFSTHMTAEDPATGSAAAPLAGYLHKYGVVKGEKARVVVQQGWRGSRRSVIEVEISESGKGIAIWGGGAVVGKGEIVVPEENLQLQ